MDVGSGRSRDELDELIDALLPDTDERLLARAELDPAGGFNSLTWLGELAAELRTPRADG